MKLKVMLKYLFSLLLIMILNNSALGQTARPKDFRGIKRGTDLSKFPDMIKQTTREGELSYYKRNNDNLMVANEPVSAIYYNTENNKLTSITIRFAPAAKYNNVKDYLCRLYNKPDVIEIDNNAGNILNWFANNNDEANISLTNRITKGLPLTMAIDWKKKLKTNHPCWMRLRN